MILGEGYVERFQRPYLLLLLARSPSPQLAGRLKARPYQ